MARGHDRERDVIRHLEDNDYVCVRAAGSLGPVDVMAVKAHVGYFMPHRADLEFGHRVLLVEVKSTAGGPYERFGPKDRAEMLAIAERCGAEAWLAYWPPCKPGQRKADALRWIPSFEWPKNGGSNG